MWRAMSTRLQGIEDDHWPLVERVVMDLESDHEEVRTLLADKGFLVEETPSTATAYINETILYAYRKPSSFTCN